MNGTKDVAPTCVVARDKLAHDVYQSVLRTRRCDWIELMNCAPMASQYHLSAYSVLKFGLSGAPYAYLPLSLQQPDLTESILSRQQKNEVHSWRLMPHLNARVPIPDSHNAIQMVEKHTDGAHERIALDLEVAMVDKSQDRHMSDTHDTARVVKTSNSHPIRYVSAGVVQLTISSLSPIIPVQLLPNISARVLGHLPPGLRLIHTRDELVDLAHISLTHTVPRSSLGMHLQNSLQDADAYALGQIRGEHLIRMPESVPLEHMLSDNGTPLDSYASSAPKTEAPVLGNLLLSSCPGKKVRLDEPAQGRSPICRDLKIDLDRIKQMGVRAIVCCLDDDELNLLGAPCREYSNEAQSHGLDLIRLPIAEGFAPIHMVRFDMFMSMLILNYTLRGSSILVHCRGGVGRAGLVACIWLLKMNLIAADPKAGPRLCPTADESCYVRSTVLRLIDIVRKRRSVRAIETAEQVRFLMEYVRFVFSQERAHHCLQTCAATHSS